MPGITHESRYQRERMTRLEISEKHLAQKMKLVSEEKRKSAVRVACELAFSNLSGRPACSGRITQATTIRI